MAETSEPKLGYALLTAVGGLWVALTGACTLNFSQAGEFGALWPIGLWFTSVGVLPLALGLRGFLPPKVLGWALSVAGAGWLASGAIWLAVTTVAGLKLRGAGGELFLALIPWVIFQAPGAFMLWGGVAMLRSARTTATPGSETTFG